MKPEQQLVIELDVEGMEIDAAVGSSKPMLRGDPLVLGKDDGADRGEHLVSRHLLTKTVVAGFSCFWI